MEIQNNQVFLGAISVEQLANDFGTPLFVYEEDVIRGQYRSLFENILYRPLVVYYACKANCNLQIMKVLHSEGAGIDACSPGDLHYALTAGYTSDQIIYTGYAVTDDELRNVIAHGIRLNVDSLAQMERYARQGGTGKIGIRINTGVRAGFHAHVTSAVTTSKFGLHPSQLNETLNLARELNLKIAGLHFHLGSDILQADPFIAALDVLLSLADQFDDLEYVDLGGGLGVPFDPGDTNFDLPDYGHVLTTRLSEWCKQRDRQLALFMEPGEFLVSESGHLIMRVVDVKPSLDDNQQHTPTFIGVDTSYNHVFSAAMYDAYHGILVANKAEEPATELVHICGNLMQAGDVLAKDRMLPPIHEGDVLVMQNCGTYAMCRSTHFNLRPLPAEVMVKAGKARLTSRRENVEDLLINQILT